MAQPIIWLTDSPSPYNSVLFRHLFASGVDFDVYYLRNASKKHPWNENLLAGYRGNVIRDSMALVFLLGLRILRGKQLLITGSWRGWRENFLICCAMISKNRYVIWSDTPSLEGQRGGIFRLLRRLWLVTILGHATVVLGTGPKAMAALQRLGADEAKLKNFPYWIDPQVFPLRQESVWKHELRGRAVNLVSVGRVDFRDKGQDLTIAALRNLEANGHDFHWFVVGDGPDFGRLENEVRKSNLASRVTLLGWVQPEELQVLLPTFDILVHPAPRLEPYGVAVIEAMAAGLVVVTSTEVGAAADRIDPGINGLVLDTSVLVSSLAGTVGELLGATDTMVQIGIRAQETALGYPISRAAEMLEQYLIAE